MEKQLWYRWANGGAWIKSGASLDEWAQIWDPATDCLAWGDSESPYTDCLTGHLVLIDPRLSPRKPVMYVAHPVSGAPIDNCFRTIRWIKALTDLDPTRIYVAPWIGEVMAYPGKAGETHHRPWDVALRDDEEVLSRFDGIVMVGGRVSDGMQREWNHARKLHKTCVDMSRFALPENLPPDFELEPAE